MKYLKNLRDATITAAAGMFLLTIAVDILDRRNTITSPTIPFIPGEDRPKLEYFTKSTYLKTAEPSSKEEYRQATNSFDFNGDYIPDVVQNDGSGNLIILDGRSKFPLGLLGRISSHSHGSPRFVVDEKMDRIEYIIIQEDSGYSKYLNADLTL